ncbi:PAS domain S-box-containing protein/diguanylate cyclase (GGDEF) domain-containing protein [Rhizobacter sp. OV335]|nr:PAS domain S-box-containing protein/diguanylate cyclase (GGDEF) domain-containing protein [Rhizobacter sp. OV335]
MVAVMPIFPRVPFHRLAALWLAGVGVCVMAGVLSGRIELARLFLNAVPASFNAGLLGLVAAVALWSDPRVPSRRLAWCAALLVLLPALVLAEHLSGLDLGIDLPALHRAMQSTSSHPGRLAPNSCLGFLFAGLALWLQHRPGLRWRSLLVSCSVYGTLAVGLSALTGYVLDLQEMYKLLSFNSMSAAVMAMLVVLGATLWSSLLAGESSDTAGERPEDRITRTAVGVLGIVAVVSGVAGFGLMQRAYKMTVAEGLETAARGHAGAFAHSLKQEMEIAESVSRQLAVQRALAQLAVKPTDAQAFDDLRELAASVLGQDYSALRVQNGQGESLLEAGSARLRVASVALPLGDGHSTLLWDDGLVLHSELPVERNGERVGGLMLERRLGVLTGLLYDLQHRDDSTDALLCARIDDDAVCLPSRFYEAGRHIAMYRKDGQPYLPISKALLGMTGTDSVKDLRDVPVQAGYAPLRGVNLGLVVKTDSGELFSYIRSRLHLLTGLLAALVLVGAWLLRSHVLPLAQRLARSERRLQMVSDNLPALVFHVDADLRYQFANARYLPMAGLDPKAMIGERMQDVLGTEAFAVIAEHIAAALRGERVRYERHGEWLGREHHHLVEYVPERRPDGSVAGLYGMVMDITERHQAQAQLAASEARLRTITDNVPALITYVDTDLRFQFCNPVFEAWTGIRVADALGRRMQDVLPPKVMALRQRQIERALRGETVQFETVAVLGQGPRHFQVNYLPHRDEQGRVIGVYSLTNDISAQKELERKLQTLARVDALTGLANRRQFEERFSEAMSRCRRSGRPMALMFMDIDKFKGINDTLGHAGGDEVLKTFGQRLSASVRKTDTVARLAGDEFVVILEGLNTVDEPHFLARKILAAISAEQQVLGHSLSVTTSIGISFYEGDDSTEGSLMALADKALYEAKSAGRGTYRCAPRSVVVAGRG